MIQFKGLLVKGFQSLGLEKIWDFFLILPSEKERIRSKI